MTALNVERIKYGWRVNLGDRLVDAERPHVAQGAVRAIVTARNGTAIYHRDTVNLTSARMRSRFLHVLDEKKVSIPEQVLIALEEACRTRPLPPPEDPVQSEGGINTAAGEILPYSDYTNARWCTSMASTYATVTPGKVGSSGRAPTGHATRAVW